MADTQDLTIRQGKTFSLVTRWETEPIVSRPITGVSFDSGVPVLTVPSHGLVDGWRSYVMGLVGPKLLNAQNNPPVASDDEANSDWHQSTVIDANTIKYAGVMPYDDNGRIWPQYQSGGALYYNTPVDLTGFAGRIQIKDKVGGTVLASSDVGDAPLDIIDVVINTTLKTITLTISATDTAAITWTKGVYELEMVSAGGVVTGILSGKVSVVREVATT